METVTKIIRIRLWDDHTKEAYDLILTVKIELSKDMCELKIE